MSFAATKQIELRIDRSSPVPLYHQLARSLEAAILEGRLQPGDRLENKTDLSARLGLSRPTGRQALQELARKGLIVRRRGSGTQVLNPKIHRDNSISSLFDDLDQSGQHPDTTIVEVGEGPEDDEAAGLLDAAGSGNDVLRVQRLRSAAGSPLAILANYIPARHGITSAELAGRSLYACLRARGVNLHVSTHRIGARLLSRREAELLDERRPAVALTAVRTVFDDSGQFVELGRHLYRASRHTLDVSLVP